MNEPYPPPLDKKMTNEELLNALVLASSWVDGAMTNKGHKLWYAREQELREMILERMKK